MAESGTWKSPYWFPESPQKRSSCALKGWGSKGLVPSDLFCNCGNPVQRALCSGPGHPAKASLLTLRLLVRTLNTQFLREHRCPGNSRSPEIYYLSMDIRSLLLVLGNTYSRGRLSDISAAPAPSWLSKGQLIISINLAYPKTFFLTHRCLHWARIKCN